MPKTITVSDAAIAAIAELHMLLSGTSVPPSTEPPVTLPAGVRVIPLPFAHTPSGTLHATIRAGETLAFEFVVPYEYNSRGTLRNFSQSPTDQNAYFNRDVCISDLPGDFSTKLGPSALSHGQEGNVFFSVGGYPTRTVGGRTYPLTDNPDLRPGRKYYANVRQQDPTLTCNINYGLAV